MLDRNDEQRLKELIDERIMENDVQVDRRFDEMCKLPRVQFEAMLKAMDQHAERLREETNARFEAMYADMIRHFKEQNIEIESCVEDKLSIMDAFEGYLPDIHKSADDSKSEST